MMCDKCNGTGTNERLTWAEYLEMQPRTCSSYEYARSLPCPKCNGRGELSLKENEDYIKMKGW